MFYESIGGIILGAKKGGLSRLDIGQIFFNFEILGNTTEDSLSIDKIL